MYTIWYIDSRDRVEKTQGGFDTLERIHRHHAVIKVQNPDGANVLNVVGGTLNAIAELEGENLVDRQSPSGDRLPAVD